MRSYKKAAICLLVAAMAVSMMTACGGGGGGGGTTDSNPGTSEGGTENPGTGEGEKPGTGEENPDDSKKDDTLPDLDAGSGQVITWPESKASKTRINSASGTIKYKTTVNTVVGSTSYTTTLVRSGKNEYVKIEKGDEAQEILNLNGDLYCLYNDKKVILKTDSNAPALGGLPIDVDLSNVQNVIRVEKGQKIIESIPYYAEKVTFIQKSNGKPETHSIIYCFDSNDRLKYMCEDNSMFELLQVSADVNPLLLLLPADYTMYAYMRDSEGNVTGLMDSYGRAVENWQEILQELI